MKGWLLGIAGAAMVLALVGCPRDAVPAPRAYPAWPQERVDRKVADARIIVEAVAQRIDRGATQSPCDWFGTGTPPPTCGRRSYYVVGVRVTRILKGSVPSTINVADHVGAAPDTKGDRPWASRGDRLLLFLSEDMQQVWNHLGPLWSPRGGPLARFRMEGSYLLRTDVADRVAAPFTRAQLDLALRHSAGR